MNAASIVIDWKAAGDGSTCYFVNGEPVGTDDRGFDAILAIVRAGPDSQVVVKAPLGGLGGQDFASSTPFGDRFSELLEALGDRRLTSDLL